MAEALGWVEWALYIGYGVMMAGGLLVSMLIGLLLIMLFEHVQNRLYRSWQGWKLLREFQTWRSENLRADHAANPKAVARERIDDWKCYREVYGSDDFSLAKKAKASIRHQTWF